jgi:RNA polymerase sigma-70 factor (ECF subfamily)
VTTRTPHLQAVPTADLGRPTPLDGPPELSDDALMLLADRDARAFATLVRRHEPALHRLATLLVNDPERARELTQDALVLAWERRHTYRPEGRLRAWLGGIVRNLARRENRRRVLTRLFLRDAPAWTSPEPLDPTIGLTHKDRDRLLAAGLSHLSQSHREALVFRFVEELDYDAMSTLLDTSASTLRSRVHHALAQLARHVPEELLR